MYLTKAIKLEDGREGVIRKLSWTELKRAAKAQNAENVAAMRELGPEMIRAFRSDKDGAERVADQIESIQKAQARKASTYDQLEILLAGVSSFDGLEQSVAGGDGKVPTGGLSVLDLDPAAAEALHEAIVAYAWEVPGKNA